MIVALRYSSALAGVELGREVASAPRARGRAAPAPTRAARRWSRVRRRVRSSARHAAPGRHLDSRPRGGRPAGWRRCPRRARPRSAGAAVVARRAAAAAARRSSIIAKISASVSAIRRLKRRWVRVQPSHRCSAGSTDSGLSEKASTSPSSSRSRVRVGPRSRPKTARRMISSVSACSRGCSATASPVGPGLDLALADLGHHSPQALHPLAVEGGQQQPALGEVDVLVEQDHRAAPHDRGQDRRALAGMHGVSGGGEQRLDVGRIGQDHERGWNGSLTVTRRPYAQALQRGGRTRPGPDQLQTLGTRGPGGNSTSALVPSPSGRLGAA